MTSLRNKKERSPETDALLVELIGQVALGEAKAFRDLYDISRMALFYCALKVVRRSDLAEDVLQEALLQIWQLSPKFASERGPAMAWMMMITRTRALDTLRKRSTSRESLTVEFLEDHDESIHSSQPDPGSTVDAKRLHEAAYQAVRCLAATQRRIISMAFYSEMTHADVAFKTGIPLGTVKTHARNGLKHLRTVMSTTPIAVA